MCCNFLFDYRGIYLHIDFFLHHSSEFWIADQLGNDLCNSIIQQFFIDLLFIITLMSTSHSIRTANEKRNVLPLIRLCIH